MTRKDLLTHPVIIGSIAVSMLGIVTLAAYQIVVRDGAIMCADGSIFDKKCSPFDPLPSKVVIAVDSRNGCPTGWKEHEEAKGRFIIGVGRHKERNEYDNEVPEKMVGQTGGIDQVKLENKHMPKHNHQNPTKSKVATNSAEDVWALEAIGKGDLGGSHKRPTGYSGHDDPAPLENMPPYIAFHLCKKN